MKLITIAAGILLSLTSITYALTLMPMSKSQVNDAFMDKTLNTIPLSTINNLLVADSLSIYFGKDGKAIGQLAKKAQNQPQMDNGTWTIKEDGQLCIVWQQWYKSKPFCDFVFDLKNSFMFYNTEDGFVSLGLKAKIVVGNQLIRHQAI